MTNRTASSDELVADPAALGHPQRSGGQVLIDQLLLHGVEVAFTVPGESFLPALDAMYEVSERFQLYVARHEAAAANMAEAYGKATGRIGVSFVTRGPGATHASIAVHTAAQDSTAMVLFVGQVPRGHMGRESFQEVNYQEFFGGMAKWVVQIEDPSRIPELVARAMTVATSGRRGPVVVALPEDVLAERVAVADARPYEPLQPKPSVGDVARFRERLEKAERPLLVVGGSGWNAAAASGIARFASAWRLPTMNSFRRQDIVDNRLDIYVGSAAPDPGAALRRRIESADLIVSVGARFGEIASGSYSMLRSPVPVQELVHVHSDILELGRVFQPTVGINSGMAEFVAAIEDIEPPGGEPVWRAWQAEMRAEYVERLSSGTRDPGRGVDLAVVVKHVRETMPSSTIVTNGAGNYTAWCHRYFQFHEFGTQIAPTNGAMGYGLPAAIGSMIASPGARAVAFAGDGCFLMSGQEMATAVQYGVNVIVIVINNGRYGTIRLHQEKSYPGRPIGTDIHVPNFSALAAAYGAHGERVYETEGFADALRRAIDADRPALIELMTDPRCMTPEITSAD